MLSATASTGFPYAKYERLSVASPKRSVRLSFASNQLRIAEKSVVGHRIRGFRDGGGCQRRYWAHRMQANLLPSMEASTRM